LGLGLTFRPVIKFPFECDIVYNFIKQLVELAHCCFYSLGNKTIDGFSHLYNYRLDCCFFLAGEIAEHIIDYSVLANGLLLRLRSSNPHPDSGEVLATQGGNNRIHPLVSSRASTLTQANLAQWQIEVIVYYEEVAQRNVMLMHQASYGFATEIHKCPGLGQEQLPALCFSEAYFCPALPVVKANRMKSGEVIQAPEASIMAIVGISPAGIPQTNYEFHNQLLYFMLCFAYSLVKQLQKLSFAERLCPQLLSFNQLGARVGAYHHVRSLPGDIRASFAAESLYFRFCL